MKKLFSVILIITVTVTGMLCIPVSAINIQFKPGSFFYEKSGYVCGVPKDVMRGIFTTNFKDGAKVVDSDGNEVAETSFVGTGNRVKAGCDAVVVVTGDVSGDGRNNSVDYLRIKKNVMGRYELKGEFMMAADANADGAVTKEDCAEFMKAFTGTEENLYSNMHGIPYHSVVSYKEYDKSKQKMPRNEITIGIFRYDGELWDDEHMSEFKNDFGGEFLMSYSKRETGHKSADLYKLCDKYGVGIFGRSLPRYTYPNPEKPEPLTDDPNYEKFDEMLKEYKYDYDCVWAEDVYDEPRAEQFDWTQGAIERFKKKFPDPAEKFIYVNLNPINGNAGPSDGFGAGNYKEYIYEYANRVDTDYICFDIYPFDNNRVGMHPNYIMNLDIISTVCRESGRDFWVIIQAGQNPADPGQKQLKPTQTQLRYQVYSSLAFGAKSIIYACYSPCWWQDGTSLVTQSGEKTYLWYFAQQLNREIKSLSPVFMNYNHTETYSIQGNSTIRELELQNQRAALRGYEGTRGFSDISTDNALLIGSFEEKKGDGYGMMLTDQTNPYDEKISNTVTFKTTFDGTVTCIQGGKEKVLKPDSSGTYSVTLASGDGAFITVK